MGLLQDILDSPHLFDNEYKRRNDIESLKAAVINAPDPVRLMVPMQRRIDELELLCKALVELLMSKNAFSEAELSVVMQQLDLADGTEDGRISAKRRRNAPRCGSCDRYVNPQRDACIYCGAEQQEPAEVDKPVRMATCGGCQAEVPEHDTYYTGHGLRCERCYSG